ncbi:MAG TPA: polyribonucleotide nucleotidyltransferase [Myxococcota bacterium]|nr:polyribonucleotide nucleotidyltransferase [Myxococcota bacterium]
METVQCMVDGKSVGIETGRLAKQSNGSVLVTQGKSAVLVTVNSAKPREGIDFFPLTVDYMEKIYAAGKIPGGFFKRERGMTEKEVLTSRFIDRALRPLFPDGYRDETQVTAQVMSADPEYETDVLAFIGASAAVMLSDVPFPAPIAAVRVSRVDGKLVANGTHAEVEAADLNVIVAGSANALVMVEGGAKQVSEAAVLEALRFGHAEIRRLIDAQLALVAKAGKAKRSVTPVAKDAELVRKIETMALDRIRAASQTREKKKRYEAFDAIDAEVVKAIVTPFRDAPRELGTLAQLEAAQSAGRKLSADVKEILHDLRGKVMREDILDGKARIDGRSTTDIRPITASVAELRAPHGSALFTRGETQALVSVTLGGTRDEQMIEGLKDTFYRKFFMHYNFLPFSTGEVRPLRAPNRREQGHGALAERAIKMVLPEGEDSPFTIRVVSEILESNGSSSMASVCGGALALMDAGIAIQAPVAGIAMGLISEGSRHAVLSDILGDEDHLGDMDFKVAGSTKGITAIQMDIKIDGLDWAVMEKALEQARQGRVHILQRMADETRDSLPGFQPRTELSENAPRISVIWIKPDRIRDLIGPGGKVIRGIQETTTAKVDVEDSGRVTIFAPNRDALVKCQQMVEEVTQEAEIGRTYVGKVRKVTDFGAFVEIFPGTDGLLHISELADRRVGKVEDVVNEGDEVVVKCLDVDPSGKIRLSRRAALAEQLEASREAQA